MDDKSHLWPTIVLFGHFGAANFGNEATLEAMLLNFHRLVPNAELQCVTTFPDKVAADYGIPALPISAVVVKQWNLCSPAAKLARKLFIGVPCEFYRWLKAVAFLWHAEAFVVVGTGLLTDAFSLGGWGPYSVFKWTLAAKIRGCKILFVSAGAGPLDRPIGRFLVKTALSLADLRSYRDESTLEYLKSIRFRTVNDLVYPDLVFSFPPEALPEPSARDDNHPIVGLGLMTLNGMYGARKPSKEQYLLYLETLVEFARWLFVRGYDVRLLIGDTSDEEAMTEFRSLLKARAVPQDFIIDEPITCTDELLSQMAAVDFVVATRFHNVLLGLLLNKPSISISFHHKCSSLMDQMGLSEYCQDIQRLSAEKLIAQFCRVEENVPKLKQMIHEKVEQNRRALDDQYKRIFQELGVEPDSVSLPSPAISRVQ